MKRFSFFLFSFSLLLALTGCEAPAPTPDGGSICGADRDCDDGLFCTGTERCMPGAAGADALGCVTTPACAAPLVCSETTDACTSTCPDADRDGHTEVSCGGDDCDDTAASAHPGATEVCDAQGVDEDCDPSTLGDTDADADGYVSAACCNRNLAGATHCGPDCDDTAPGVHPTEAEECNHVDDDCDSTTDEGVLITYYTDGDHDGYGDDASPVLECTRPADTADRGGDCNDGDADVNPAIPETCNDIDDDCDGHTDEGLTSMRYRDADGDSFGGGATVPVCPGISGYSDVGGDCDDTVLAVHPGATELCNDVDDDCNGMLDGPNEDIDFDGDAPASCGGTDCVPFDPAIHGGAVEVCDAVDQDCDPTTRSDGDGDGHRDARGGCVGGPQASLPADDCDDTIATVYPGASELCDHHDNDCDGTTDGAAADATCTAMGPPHEAGTCGGSGCTYACATGYGECDAAAPGCETDFRAPATCGSCTNVCAAGLECDTGRCGPREQWVFRIGSTGTDAVEGVARASSGHVFVAATTNATIDLGSGPLASAGGTDGLVVALDASGVHRWSRRIGASADDRTRAIATDDTGGAIVVGQFDGTIALGTTMLVAHATAPATDAFVIAYDDAGTVRWARALGHAGDGAEAVAVSAAMGRIAVGGVFSGSLVVDATTTLVAGGGGGLDYFVIVYDDAGTVVHARAFGAPGVDDDLQGIAIDDTGRVSIGGNSDGFAIDAIDFTGREISRAGFLLGLGADLGARWVDAPDCPDDGSAFGYRLEVVGAGGSSGGGACATFSFEGTCSGWGTARDGGESGAHCVDASGTRVMNEDFDERYVDPSGIWSDPSATWLVGTFGGVFRGLRSGTGAADGFLARQAPATVTTFVLRNTSGVSVPSEVTHGAGHLVVGGSFSGTVRVGSIAVVAVAGDDGFVAQLDE